MKNNKGMSKASNPTLEGHLRDTQHNKGKSGKMKSGARQELGYMGGERPDEYEDWNKSDLYDQAKDLGIEEIAHMDKEQLIAALRDR